MKQNSAANYYSRRDVIKAATQGIDRITAIRNEKVMEVLAPLMKPRKKYGIFGHLVTRTKDEALQVVSSIDMWGADDAHYSQMESLKLILKAAQAYTVSPFFWMTKEEFDDISNWYNKGEQ